MPSARSLRINFLRNLHLSEFTKLLVEVVRLARELGLVKLGTIAVDGTKIKTNASRQKATSYPRMRTATKTGIIGLAKTAAVARVH